METITLESPWTYRTPLATIEYPAGTHSVFAMIAEAARAAGVTQEESDGDTDKPAKARKTRAADDSEG